jgi:hypothetical protein
VKVSRVDRGPRNRKNGGRPHSQNDFAGTFVPFAIFCSDPPELKQKAAKVAKQKSEV